jgi:hypothetical protein
MAPTLDDIHEIMGLPFKGEQPVLEPTQGWNQARRDQEIKYIMGD